MGRAIRRHLGIILAYAVLAVVWTWPLALNMGAAIPGVEGDAASFVWALGWAKTALVDVGVNPFHTDFVFYPLGGATQLLWAVSLIGLASLPLQLSVGLIAAYNWMYLGATVLTAYGTFLLALEVLAGPIPGALRRGRSALLPPPSSGPLPPFATFLLVDYITRGPGAEQDTRLRRAAAATWPAFAAGLVMAFAPLRLGYGLAFLNLFNTEFIPFYVLYLIRAIRNPSARNIFLAGLFLGLNAYIDFQIVAFLILFTALFVAYALWVRFRAQSPLGPVSLVRGEEEKKENPPSERVRSRFMQRARLVLPWTLGAPALAGGVAFLVAAPMLLAVASDLATEGGNYIGVYKIAYSAARSYDLLTFVLPNARSSLYAGWPLHVAGVNAGVQTGDESALSPDRQVFAGYIVLALAIFALVRRRRQALFWLLVAVLYMLSSLGPELHVLGHETGIPLPFLLLHEIPILNHIRIPMRYAQMASLALALLVALGMDALRDGAAGTRRPSLWRMALLLLLPLALLLETAPLPYPMQPVPIPPLYEQIAREPGNFTVLEIPSFNWRAAALTEMYQAIHHKRILRAYTNRIAPGPAEYVAFRGTPIVVRSLRILEGAEKGEFSPEELEQDRAARDAVLDFFDLRYAVLHRSLLTPEETARLDAYVREVLGGRVISDAGDVIGYRLPRGATPSGPLSIDLRQPIGQMYAGRGWQFEYPPANWDGEFDFVWTKGAQSEVYFVSPSPAERVLTVHAYSAAALPARVSVNGTPVGEMAFGPEWKDYTLVLPARQVVVGMNRVEWAYGASLEEKLGMTVIQVR